ncbi:MAG: signal peptidase II [Bacteroidetes bacterium]|nr:signal peptidase II [Bacteroidota bacterium]
MPSNKISKIIIIALLVFLNISCDQVSKKIVRNKLRENDSIEMLHNHLTLMRVENSGAFLSFGDSFSKSVKSFLLSVLPVIALALALVYVYRKKNINAVSFVAICCIIGGGIGNIIDRIAYGSVTDFLYLHFGIFHTGVFNMADLSITTGAMVILLQSAFRRSVVKEG